MDMIEAIRHKTNSVIELFSSKDVKLRGGFPSRPFLIAIDGRCGAGKTTLSIALRNAIERRIPKPVVTVIHMDDFYPRPDQRTDERFKSPGGNVDHERFLAEVLEKLRVKEGNLLKCLDLLKEYDVRTIKPTGEEKIQELLSMIE